jgi:uncharacterized protein
MSATPRTTSVALVATLAVTAAALVSFLAAGNRLSDARAYLVLFGGLFLVRVVGQIGVIAFRPAWLPPKAAWNFMPYPLLLPTQLALLAVMGMLVRARAAPAPELARGLIVLALVYWAAMGVRYALQMRRRPEQRWLGGAIPIVFHCVLASFVFVLGASHVG